MAKAKTKPQPKPAAKSIESSGVSAATLAINCDISKQRVGQLESEGVFKRNANGKFDVEPNVIGYIRWLRDETRRGTKSSGAAAFQRARTREIEQRIAREDGKLIPIEEVQAGISDILGTYRAELSGVPTASTRDLELRAVIESKLNGAIERCRARFEKMESDLRGGREVGLDSEEADA